MKDMDKSITFFNLESKSLGRIFFLQRNNLILSQVQMMKPGLAIL